MDWTAIILALLSGTTVGGVVEAFRYRRENRRLKENEVTMSSVDAQRQEIDLADLYKDKVLAMLDQVAAKQDSGNDNQRRILDKLDRMEDKGAGIEEYLNGPYHEWLAKNDGSHG